MRILISEQSDRRHARPRSGFEWEDGRAEEQVVQPESSAFAELVPQDGLDQHV